jgi:hypothetical protein
VLQRLRKGEADGLIVLSHLFVSPFLCTSGGGDIRNTNGCSAVPQRFTPRLRMKPPSCVRVSMGLSLGTSNRKYTSGRGSLIVSFCVTDEMISCV